MLFKGPTLPARSLIALIVAITLVPLATLLWLGWRLLDQDRLLEDKQVHEHVEHAADLLVATFQRSLSSDAQRLAAGAEDWPEGAVAITFRNDRIEAYPRNRVAYLPMVPVLPEAPDAVFAEGEKLESQQNYSSAIEVFRVLAESTDPAVRAGGLLRLGRNLAESGRIEDALAVYNRLDSLDSVAIAGTPAGLIGRYMRCDLMAKQKGSTELQKEVERLTSELASGRWALTYSLYGLSTQDVAQWSGAEPAGTREPEAFAEAANSFWEQRRSLPPSGNKQIAVGDQHLVALWQGSEGSFRVLLASQEYAESHWLSAAATLAKEQHVSFHIDDAANSDSGRSAKRSAKETDLPWNLFVASSGGTAQAGDFAVRRKLLIAGFLLLIGMVLAANYLIIRAVSHERAVARLQTDFVAAVSHEFRTPLTALRQFTDMLREHEGRAPEQGKDRRMVCYDAQSRATNRLTRLVESLLDFGRMEAGVRQYSFGRRDCTEFVSQVVQDFRSPAEAAGHRVEFSGNGSALIEADGESLSMAIWNLLDNAVKYSPGNEAIEVGLHRHGGDVRIDVRDFGIGIPAHERAAIFSKFQRGEQARIRGIKGTGIGLTMVAEIVRAHHGRVEVKSELGKGSTFTIVLPSKD